jgi:hypothetical protein
MIFPWILATFHSHLVQNVLPHLYKETLAFPYGVARITAVEISLLADVILVNVVLAIVMPVDNFSSVEVDRPRFCTSVFGSLNLVSAFLSLEISPQNLSYHSHAERALNRRTRAVNRRTRAD